MSLAEVKNNYKKQIDSLQVYFDKYGIDSVDIKSISEALNNFYVVTPLIGGFSSGKSSLINTLMENNLLPTEITPETSIPTEIIYSVREYGRKLSNNIWSDITLEDIKTNNYSYKDTSLLNAFVNSQFMKEISTVKIVDIPGLDSGIESHNKAIDNYLLNSLAYIITVDTEQGLTESVILFLKELNLLDIPVLIVITKSDKKTQADVEAMINDVKHKITNIINVEKFEITSSSARKKDVEPVKEFLKKIQSQAEEIFSKSFKDKINRNINIADKYLTTRLNKQDFSVEEIEGQEKLLVKQIEELIVKVQKEKEKLANDIEKCSVLAEGKMRMSLENSADSLVNDLINKRDHSKQINSIVRTSILESIQSEINPRIQRYFKNISELAEFNISVNADIDVDPIKNKMNDLMKDTVKKTIPFALAAIGFSVGGPIGAIVAGAISIIAELFFEKKKQEDAKRAAETKVRNELIPQITQQAAASFRITIQNYLIEINEKVEETINKDKEFKEKALEDLRKQKAQEESKQKKTIMDINTDIEIIKSLYIK